MQNGRLPFAVVSGTSVYAWIATNTDPDIRAMLAYAVLVPSPDDAYARLQDGTVVAVLHASIVLKWYTTLPPCNSVIVGMMSDDNYVALASSPSFPYSDILEHAQLQAFQAGLLRNLDSKYFADASCVNSAKSPLQVRAPSLLRFQTSFDFLNCLL
jgi:hypothetical protein